MSPYRAATQSAFAVSSRQYLVPLIVLVFAITLTMLLQRNFERAVEILAPVMLIACALCVIAGVVYWSVTVGAARRRATRHAEIRKIVEHLAAGRFPKGVNWIGRSWRAFEDLRTTAASRPSRELDLVRAGLRQSGAGKLVARRGVNSRQKWERVRAIQDLGWLDDREALPILYHALADADDDIAWAALAALGGMSDLVADQVLLELLDDGRFAASRIADVLDARRYQRPLTVLQERARTSSEGSLFWIAYLLGRSLQPSALSPLLELAHHKSPNVRASAAEAIGRLGSQAAVDTLLRMVKDDVWFVRLHASRSLGDLAARTGMPVLQKAALDSNWYVRRSALDSLQRLREAV